MRFLIVFSFHLIFLADPFWRADRQLAKKDYF